MRQAFILLGIFMAACAGGTAQAQGKQDFTLINATGYAISHVYVSPNNDDDWGEDVMGKDILAEDEEVPIEFARKENICKWDLKVTYEDDNSSVIWRGFDLCKISRITIRYDRKTDRTSASTE